MIVECCDLCHQEPTPFFSDTGSILWYVVCDADGEPAHLMDDLEYKFMVCDEKNPERLEGRQYYCGACIEKISEDNHE